MRYGSVTEHLPSISRPSTHPCATERSGEGKHFLSVLSILTCRGQHRALSQVNQGSTHPCCPTTHHHPITARGAQEKMSLMVLVRTYSACHDLTNQHSEGNHRNWHQTKSTGGLLAWGPDISWRTQRERMNDLQRTHDLKHFPDPMALFVLS